MRRRDFLARTALTAAPLPFVDPFQTAGAVQIAAATSAVAKVHPDLPREFEGGRSKSWDQDPWARGAFAILRPGDVARLEPHIARAEGRIHFAGEHTSPWLGGWMHSALESGERVAREINAQR